MSMTSDREKVSRKTVVAESVKMTRIEPEQAWWKIDLRELISFRELFYTLVKRDFTVKYKQTLFGISWALIKPLFSTFVFTMIFGKIGGLSTDGIPKPLFYLAGLSIWRYFDQSLVIGSGSLIGNQFLLTKTYIPRLVVPITSVFVGLIDLMIAVLLLVAMALLYGVPLGSTVAYLPLLTLMAALSALGPSLLFSALNVQFRDIRQLVPFIVQFWMYITIILPYSAVAEYLGGWKWLYGFNPMAAVVEGYRWCLFHAQMKGAPEFPLELLIPGLFSMVLMLAGGFFVFRRFESRFADVV